MFKVRGRLRSAALCTVLASIAVPTAFASPISAQTSEAVALQRGYRTGYSDGYMSGYRDTIDSASRSHIRHVDYKKADRAYSKEYGQLEDYRDGYQQGFELGYETGYERRSFESSLPSNLKKRGFDASENRLAESTSTEQKVVTPNPPASDVIASLSSVQNGTPNSDNVSNGDSAPSTRATSLSVDIVPTNYQTNSTPIIIIPRDTELILELQNDLSTEEHREGEKFTARVVSPSEIAGATVEGRINKILKPGHIKRRSELSLSFERIVLDDQRWSNFGASLMEVLAIKGDNIKRVDSEGTALGQSSLKNDAIKVGGSTGAGALIGGVVGGPVGVAVGAGVGAAFGVGAVVIERGKHIRLTRNQQLRIKTAYQTQIR